MVEEKQYFNLKYDAVFKTVIADLDNPLFLEKIISLCLKQNVEVVSFSPNDLKIKNIKERRKVIDVLVQTKSGIRINVEVNIGFGEAIKLRNLAYYMSYYSQEIQKGESYSESIRTIQININIETKKESEAIENYYIMNEKTHEKYTESIRIVNVNIDEIRKNWYDNGRKLNDELIYLVALNADKEELEKLGNANHLIKKVGEKVAELNTDEEFVRLMSEEEDQRKMLNTKLLEGIKEGREEGIKEGIEKGEHNKSIDIATSMLKEGFDVSVISKMTSLTKKEINKIKNELNKEN